MKTQNIFLLLPILLLGLLLAFLNSCEKEEEEIEDTIISIEHLTGVVQKGPFINGTQIQMYELNASLSQTGSSFSTQVHSDVGTFEITDIELASNFVEFLANGFYYNEVSGELSSAQLSLNAISDVTDHTTINVNILTHLEKRRVEYLVKEQGKSFYEAKSMAQSEVIAAFGIHSDQMDNSENLDIIEDTESNAVLLAISVILQGSLNVGELTELLATIANDMRENGVINNESLMADLRESTLGLDLETIRDNLEARYAALGIDVTVADFESFINVFLAYTGFAPIAVTTGATDITTNSALLMGTVHPGWNETTVIFEYGLTEEYSHEVVAEQSPIDGSTNVSVSAFIDDLDHGTTYHFRIAAENALGVSYGTMKTFTTFSEDDMPDIDGNYYRTVIIGNQEWMAENLRVTKYNNGDAIPTGLSNHDWYNTTEGAYAIYDHWHAVNNGINSPEEMVEAYGKLYNWHAVNTGNLCPAGWSVPSHGDWTQLMNYVASQGFPNEWNNPNGAGNALKSCRQVGSPLEGCNTSEHPRWNSHGTHYGFDKFGFSALPGGRRRLNGSFDDIGYDGYWWSATVGSGTHAWLRLMRSGSGGVTWGSYFKPDGLSVRCFREVDN